MKDTLVDLNLAEARQQGNNQYSWSKKPLSHDEMVLAGYIQPSANGQCVMIQYDLEVKCVIDATCCNSGGPSCRASLFVHPPYLPTFGQLQAPQNWSPTVYDQCQISMPGQPPLGVGAAPAEKVDYNFKAEDVGSSPAVLKSGDSNKETVKSPNLEEESDEEESEGAEESSYSNQA